MDTLVLQLLESIKDRPRQLSMSKTPVDAIVACFKMIDEGLVFLGETEYHTDLIFIPEKGKKILEEQNVQT